MKPLNFVIIAIAADLISFNRYANTAHRHVTERTAALGSNHLKVQMILQGLNNGKLNMAKHLIEHDDKRSFKVAGYRLSYYLSQ